MANNNETARNRDLNEYHVTQLGLDYTPVPGVIPPVEDPVFQQKYWSPDQGTCVVEASRPLIPVPVTQNIINKDTIVEVEQIIVTDRVQPQVFKQDVYHEVPRLAVSVRDRPVNIPKVKISEVTKEVEIPVSYDFKFRNIWQEREVPRLFPKYCGPQDIIEVGIPQIQVVDEKIEHEIPLYVGEKLVEKEVVEEEGVEVVSYKYVHQEEEVPVYKYRPVFDVEVSIPPPMLLPITVAPKQIPGGTETITWDEYQRQVRTGSFKTRNQESACDSIVCGRQCKCSKCCCLKKAQKNMPSSPPPVIEPLQ